MKNLKNLLGALCLVSFVAFVSCSPDNTPEHLLSIHPRIMLLEGEEDIIRESIETSQEWRKMHEAIIAESDNIINLPPVEREITGRRLLDKSREALHRVFYLSYSYRMTDDEKYFKRAEREMLAAAGFSDWNPSHFLDVSEMTMALAIGYDWLYDELSDESREIIREAILTKGLEPSLDPDYNWFLNASNNWNQVCNAGMTFGALAIYEDFPEISEEIIDRSFNSIVLAMEDYKPDGAYPEGYGYWGYGTSFNILFLTAVDKIWPGRFDYDEQSAFLETGSFRKNMIGPTLQNFNWGDNTSSSGLSPSMFWFADRNNESSLLWKEKYFLDTDDYSKFTRSRVIPAIMIWGKDIPFDEITRPDYNMYVAQGHVPVSLMRTSWGDPEAIFLGLKGGSPSANHGHMDVGSFVMEAEGVRWSSDLGRQGYHSLESLGMNIWARSQDAERWKVYRLNNYSHSTLTVNGELQRVDGFSGMDRYSDDPDFYYSISDISSLYETELTSVVRGAGLVDREYVVLRDELETGPEPATVRWQMLTEADVEITGSNTATLTSEGKQLFFRVDEPAGINVTTWSTDPGTEWDASNLGSILIGFEVVVPENESSTLDVKLIPASAGTEASFSKNLADW